MPNNPFIDQEMNYEITKNDETSETSKGDIEKKNSENFYKPEQYVF